MNREPVKLALLVAASLLVSAALGLAIWSGYAAWRKPGLRGRELNRAAWEASFTERGLAVPPAGPREGYWGRRLGAKLPDPRTGWREREVSLPGLLEIDADGFQHDTSGAAGAARIVVFGGSVAFGAYASSINTTWFHALRLELERAGTPADIVVVAAGAWKSVQELRALRAHGSGLRPDLVVFLDGLNDLTNGATARALFGERVPTRDGSEWTVFYHSHDYDERVALYLDNVARAAREGRRLGGDVLVVLQPSLVERARLSPLEEHLLARSLEPHASAKALRDSYEAMRRGLRGRAAAGALHFQDASKLFDAERATTFSDLWHFSDAGHALLARAMAREIEPILRARARASGS